MSWVRHLGAIALPGTVAGLVPALLLLGRPPRPGWGLPGGWWVPVLAVGVLVALAGLALVVRTVRLFATEGEGTLAPWDPPQRMVVRGPYRYLRNPMISGVMAILLGETLALGSAVLAGWFAVFVAVNATYIPLVEEPGLTRRFGTDYVDYRRAVPRWLPRVTPWQPAR
jgi:protein-S-isoprenylcysteine O-methyltransferase Ste14